LLLAQPVSRFRQGVLRGQWDLMDGLVDEMQLHPNCRARVCFLIYRQKYLELLEAGGLPEALCCLREQLAPMQAHITAHEPTESSACAVEHNALRELSCYLMCGHIEELKRRAAWDGTQGSSRQMLLQELQRHIPPSLLLPDNRLLTLLQQAVLWQTSQCFDQQSFCTSSSSSLFEDFSCSRNVIPRETHHILDKHSDEVWYVQFSHNGELLASASKDNMVIVWDVRRAEMTHLVVLVGHTNSLSFVAWSPDDSQLLTCGNDRLIKLWQVSTGECVRTFNKHTDNVTACAWLPDGRHFISASIDKNIFLWDGSTGALIQTWHGPRVNDLAVSHSGQHVVAICADKKIRLCELGREGGVPLMLTAQEHVIDEADSITSLSLSRDSRHLLVNTASEGIHAWDLATKQLIHRYQGQKQGRFVIRSAFGGCNEAFVVSGSEDSQIYVWHRHNATLLEVLAGHSGTVNAVAWNPRDPYMMASASDDQTVRIWGVQRGNGLGR